MSKPWMVFNVGCIECGVSSAVVGLYRTRKKAEAVAAACHKEYNWREGGQNDFQVFDLRSPATAEYVEAGA